MRIFALGLLLSVAVMTGIGMLMLFSTGSFSPDAYKVRKVVVETVEENGSGGASVVQKEVEWDPSAPLRKQLLWLAIGIAACVAAALVDYDIWRKTWPWLFGLAVALLALCFVFPKINGAHRWIRVGSLSLQPSEIGKLAAVVFLAAWLQQHAANAREFLRGFAYPLAVVGVPLLLIAGEVDMGTAAVIGATALAVLFIGGASLRYVVPLALSAPAALVGAAVFIPNRAARMLAFLDMAKYKETFAFQQYMGLIALGSGGLEGLGLGNGRQKFSYLPFAHTDFIFPTIGEELGWVTLVVVGCYVVFLVCGIKISLNARDRFGLLLGVGITVLITLQAALNIGVTTALLPNKGIPLPFISYGGTNLLFCLLGLGILLNIHRNGQARKVVVETTRRRVLMTARI